MASAISAGTIFAKTPLGAEEVRSRKMKLPPKLRTMLILVDGAKPLLVLRDEAQALGLGPDFIAELEKLGLVKVSGGGAPAAGAVPRAAAPAGAAPAAGDAVERFRTAQQFMNDTAVNALGIKAFFFTLKLEKCATLEDLRDLVGPYRDAITKGSGAAEADVLSGRLLELIGT